MSATRGDSNQVGPGGRRLLSPPVVALVAVVAALAIAVLIFVGTRALERPAPPATAPGVLVEGTRKGPAEAKVSIVEFFDFL